MNSYTLTVLIKEKVDEKGRTALLDDVKKGFGNLIKEDLWGVRTLAYEIKHMDKAFFAYYEFESEPASIITLDKNIRLNEDIIRYLLIKGKKAKKMGPGRTKKAEDKHSLRSDDLKQSLRSDDLKPVAKAEEKVEAEVKAEVSEDKPKTKRVVKIGAKKKE